MSYELYQKLVEFQYLWWSLVALQGVGIVLTVYALVTVNKIIRNIEAEKAK